MDEKIVEKVVDVIQQALDKGKSLDEIKQFMLGSGYSEEDITSILTKLNESKSETQKTPQKKYCTKCGDSIGEGEFFCTQCGNRLKMPDLRPEKKEVCPTCGDPIDPGEIFCTDCGTRLFNEPAPLVPVTPVQSQAAGPVPVKKGSSKKKIAIVLGVIAILLIAIFATYYLFGQQISEPTGAVIYGQVYDYSNRPMQGVLVSSNSLETRTDNDGDFELQLESSERQVLSFEHYGFVPIHKIVQADITGRLFYKIIMPEMEDWITVSQTGYSTSADAGEVKLTFGKSSFGRMVGNFTPGDVSFSLTYFDPSDERDIEAFPGDFETDEGEALESFGFGKLMVQDSDGNQLDLVDNKTAKLKMKAIGKCNDLPDEMPLWYFDEDLGYWIYKTTAKKGGYGSNCYYEGEIDTVASWWNCDISFERSFWELLVGGIADLWNYGLDQGERWAAEARALLGLDGEFDDDFLTIPWNGGPVETLDDFIEFVRATEALFPEASNRDIINLLRESTRYGERSQSDQDLGSDYNRLGYGFIFEGGELGENAGYPLDFAGIMNGGLVSHDGRDIDMVHLLVGADSYYQAGTADSFLLPAGGNTLNLINSVGRALGADWNPSGIPESYEDIASMQMQVDFNDIAGRGVTGALTSYQQGNIPLSSVLSTAIGEANPADLRGDVLGVELGSQAAADRNVPFSTILENYANGQSNPAADVDSYEDNFYNPIQNGQLDYSQIMTQANDLTSTRPQYNNLVTAIDSASERIILSAGGGN